MSVRSIYRDIDSLREQGASIEGAAGVGYLLRPGFLLPPLIFTGEELEALVLGLRLAAEHGDDGLGRAAVEVAAKLRAVLPRDLRDVLDETALLAGPALQRPPERVEVAEIRRCLRASQKARIAYTDQHGVPSVRVIWPIAIGFFERSRVVIAWCEQRGDFRSFRVDRLLSWASLPERLGRSRLVLLGEWQARERIPVQLPG